MHVSAMEAVGVAQAIERYAARRSGRRIPYTNVSVVLEMLVVAVARK